MCSCTLTIMLGQAIQNTMYSLEQHSVRCNVTFQWQALKFYNKQANPEMHLIIIPYPEGQNCHPERPFGESDGDI